LQIECILDMHGFSRCRVVPDFDRRGAMALSVRHGDALRRCGLLPALMQESW